MDSLTQRPILFTVFLIFSIFVLFNVIPFKSGSKSLPIKVTHCHFPKSPDGLGSMGVGSTVLAERHPVAFPFTSSLALLFGDS